MSIVHTPRLRVHRPHVSPLFVTVVALAAGLLALGSWVLVDRYAGDGGFTHDATTLIDRLDTAYSTGDAQALDSYYAEDAVIVSLDETYVGLNVIRALADGSFTAERIAPVTTQGEFATTFARLQAVATGETGITVSTFQIRDGKVMRQWNFGLGVTPPFDNAVSR